MRRLRTVRISRPVRSGPIGSAAPSYCAIRPHTGTRACTLSSGSTASKTLAADVLEVHVDAVGAGGGQLLRQVGVVAVEAGIEAQLVDHRAALGRAAGNPDHPAAQDLRDLPDRRAHRAACGGHDHRLAGLRPADVGQAHVGGEARMPSTPSASDGCVIAGSSRVRPLPSLMA